MLLARRITGILASLLVAHTTWVGTGYTCSMPEMGQRAEEVPSMAGMNMSSAEMAHMDMSSVIEQRSDAPMHDHESCELPWAPDGCQSMGPCASPALASLQQPVQAPASAPLQVASRLVLTPPSQVRAPELPPPRA